MFYSNINWIIKKTQTKPKSKQKNNQQKAYAVGKMTIYEHL